MKKVKKLVAVLLVGVMTLTCLTACGDKEGSNKATGDAAVDIEINYWNAGLGREWLDAVAKAFNEEYPQYNAVIMASASVPTVKATLGMEIDTVDLYLLNTQTNTSVM